MGESDIRDAGTLTMDEASYGEGYSGFASRDEAPRWSRGLSLAFLLVSSLALWALIALVVQLLG